MGKFFERLCSPETLANAYRAVRSASGMWCPGMSMRQLRHDPVIQLVRLVHDLMSGHYRPDPVKAFDLAKADGSSRSITVYSVRDRLVQRAALLAVQPLGERLFLDSSYGFRPHVGVDMAVARVREWVRAGYTWLVDGDIHRCFDSIPQRRALRLVAAITRDREYVGLLRLWLTGAPDGGLGLPQGMVLSPFLCNLYLHGFDFAMRHAGIPLVRYADDFILFAHSRSEAQAARDSADHRLQALGLELHPTKTRVIRTGRGHRFLGRRLPDKDICARAN